MDADKLMAGLESEAVQVESWPAGQTSPALTQAPVATVYPQTQAALASVLTYAHQHQLRVLPTGSGSKLGWGTPTAVDLVVSTARLDALIEHAVGDLTVTVAAGMPLARLQAQLATTGQILPLDPAFPQQATLGGIVATADTGALRQRYGGVRDLLIGITFVRHDGQVAHGGGRVVKNVAGYDLMKLLTGSYGTLGVISQLTFRTYPVAEASQTVLFTGYVDTIAPLLAALRRSVLTPVALDIFSAGLRAGSGLTLAAQFQSIAAGVQAQVSQLLRMGQELGLMGQTLTGEEDASFWKELGAALWADGATVAKVGVPMDQAAAWLAQLPPGAQGRIHGRGVGLVRLPANAGVEELRSHLQSQGGYLTLLRAPAQLKAAGDPWGYSGNALAVMRAVKAQFDPDSRLSPGRFVGGL